MQGWSIASGFIQRPLTQFVRGSLTLRFRDLLSGKALGERLSFGKVDKGFSLHLEEISERVGGVTCQQGAGRLQFHSSDTSTMGKARHSSGSGFTKKGEFKMVTLNIPLFLGPKAVCEILDCSFGEVRMLIDTGKLSGGRTINGLKVSTESICLLLGQKELMKKSHLWLKGSPSKPIRPGRRMIDPGV